MTWMSTCSVLAGTVLLLSLFGSFRRAIAGLFVYFRHHHNGVQAVVEPPAAHVYPPPAVQPEAHEALAAYHGGIDIPELLREGEAAVGWIDETMQYLGIGA